MEKLNFYSHEKVSEGLYIFTEGYSMVHRFTIGVIIGAEKILVIDAGLGADDSLRAYIEGVVGAGKPLVCALTHLHPDHAGSSKLFDEAFVSYKDWPALSEFSLNRSQRLEDLDAFALGNAEVMQWAETYMLNNSDAVFKNIEDGYVFDLGGVQIEAMAIPGHSEGSMAFYNRKEKYVFTGDGINTDVHLKKMDREAMIKYIFVLEHFLQKVKGDVKIYPAHLPLVMNTEIVRNLIAVCKDLVSGNTYGDPPGETIFAKRNNNPAIRMHYFNNTAVVYNEDLLQIRKKERNYLNFYSHEKVGDRVYVITEGYSMVHRFTIGLIAGDDINLVIDSGLGMDKDLRQYIERIVGASKPIICACTHGAIDHAGAACLFDEAYLNSRDYPMLPSAFDRGRRIRDLGAFSLFNNEVIAYGRTNMLDNTKSVFKDIDDGFVFNLGGVSVRAIALPGHSPGHLTYFIPEENIAFGGDGINIDTHIKGLDREGLLAYAKTLRHFLSITGDSVVIYAGHLNRPHGSNVPKNLALACEEVANGLNEDDPPGETIFLEKAGNPSVRMHYHGNSCIIYDSSLLK
jgi:glyoxylase-like metal-dependent hydrolase (beta-lactamase superfamily II)